MNYHPLILTCECGYQTPGVGRNGVPVTEAKARDAFKRHSCEKRTRKCQAVMVPCPECGVPRLINRTNNYKRRVCRDCSDRRWQVLITERHKELDEMAVERLLMGIPVVSTRAERQSAIEYLTQRGMSAREIARRLRMSARTVQRLRARAA